jgi:hypothetical protein
MSTDPGVSRYPPPTAATSDGEATDTERPSPTPSAARRRPSTREAAEGRRRAKLDLVREQVESGSLVIRPMTEEERQRYPPRPFQQNRTKRPWI